MGGGYYMMRNSYFSPDTRIQPPQNGLFLAMLMPFAVMGDGHAVAILNKVLC